ncbi:MAG: hypothetical protein O9343_11255 [Burkholderiaceae bacterium]|jgi:hypothetical protein|nr:hypothetical protein [Burkholderiaceae bacterium]MCZ8175760.1 hypothetical protein [Burkholderiaceae bacterium]
MGEATIRRFCAARARQALGAPGWPLGRTPWLCGPERAQAAAELRRFLRPS